MAKGNQKSQNFGIVINAPTGNEKTREYLESLESALYNDYVNLNLGIVFLASIIHDKDTENNKPKRTHLHVFIETAEKSTFSAVLSNFSSKLDILPEQISIEPSNNGYLLVQYLTHKNSPQKYQYDINLVKSTNSEKLTELYNFSYKPPLTISDIQHHLINDLTLAEFITNVGLEFGNKFRATFNDVKKEQNRDYNKLFGDIQDLQEENIALERAYKSLADFTARIFNSLNHSLTENEKRIANLEELETEFLRKFYTKK